MASNGVTIEAKLNEKGVVDGAKKIKVSLEDIKKADGGLKWDGMKDGERAAKASGDGFTVLKGVLANLATKGIDLACSSAKNLAASVVETGQTFETSMSKVAALSGASGDNLAALEAKAREMGASTTFSASQAADALGYMALAGWDTEQMLDGIGGVLTLAQAGEMGLAAASDLVTDYLSAFNMTAADTGRMVDVLAYAQANANTNTEQLGMAFKNCAANCNAAGMDVETTSAAIAMMSNQGLKGSEAGTALNAVMRDMTAKMEDGAIAIGEQSVAVMDAEGNYRNFADILADVEDATDGMGDAEKASALQATFTADSIKGLNLMLNAGSGELVGFRDELYNCNGAAQQTADTMTDNLGGDLAAMGSAFEELQLKIYEGLQGPLRDGAQFVTDTIIPAFNDAIDAIGGFIDDIADWVSGIDFGPAMEMLDGMKGGAEDFGNAVSDFISGAWQAFKDAIQWGIENLPTVVGILGGIAAGIAAYTAYSAAVEAFSMIQGAYNAVVEAGGIAQWALNAAMEANPIGIIIGLIAGLVAAFVILWNNSEEFRNFWTGLWDGICSFVGDAINSISSTISTVLSVISEVWGSVWGAISPFASSVWEGISSAISSVVNGISSTISGVLNSIASVWSSIWSAVSSVASSVWNGIKGAISGVINGIASAISSVFNGIKSTVTSVWNGIKSAIETPINAARDLVKGAIDAIKGFFSFNIEWPHIPLPHFGINPPGWQIGDLLKGSIPSLAIDWYATGGVFNGPSVIGVGEAGTEFVIPRDGKHMRPFAEAVAENMQGAGDTREILASLEVIHGDLAAIAGLIPKGWSELEFERMVAKVVRKVVG